MKKVLHSRGERNSLHIASQGPLLRGPGTGGDTDQTQGGVPSQTQTQTRPRMPDVPSQLPQVQGSFQEWVGDRNEF